MLRRSIGFFAAVGLLASGFSVKAAESEGIAILAGSYGKPGNWRRVDIAARLQDLCGKQGTSCEIWCSQSPFGGRDLGRHSACRVIYRCPDGATRSEEAQSDEPLLMRCQIPEAQDRNPAAALRH